MRFWHAYWKSLLFFLGFGVLPAWFGFSLLAYHVAGYRIPEWLLFRFGRIGVFPSDELFMIYFFFFGYFFGGCLAGTAICHIVVKKKLLEKIDARIKILPPRHSPGKIETSKSGKAQ